MDTSVLEDIGLSPTEIKVFLIISSVGESKAGKIIEKSKLQSSSVYNAINSLIEKGFVSYIKKSQIKYYKAADPEAILDYIEQKKKEYLRLLPELKARQNREQNEGVEYFKSHKGIKTIISEMLKDAKKGDIYRTFSIETPEEYEEIRKKIFMPMKQIFKEKKIIQKGIFHEAIKHTPKAASRMKKRYLKIPMPPSTLILNDKVAIISWKDEPSGILINSKDISSSYKQFFDAMWKIAEK
jgi:sugar-specific transcriptional regulator TrmB